jgi:hypothetical protein
MIMCDCEKATVVQSRIVYPYRWEMQLHMIKDTLLQHPLFMTHCRPSN